jgi:Glycine-zipper domain
MAQFLRLPASLIPATFLLAATLSNAQEANQQIQQPNAQSNPGKAGSTKTSSLSSSLGVYVFPAKNQTPQQQNTDEAACFSWAEGQTGINPMADQSSTAQSEQQQKPQQPASKSTKGSGAKGAAGGAAGGAAIGAIAGNAGEGAAIGATAGAVHGRRQARKAEKKAEEQQKQQEAQQQQQAQTQAQAQAADRKSTYNKAFSACMEGKGYTVK